MPKYFWLFFAIAIKVTILLWIPNVISDVGYYAELAEQMMAGLVPYIDFKFEYPPLAILPIYLPALLQKLLGGIFGGIYEVYFRGFLFFCDLGFLIFIFSQLSPKHIVFNALGSLALAPLIYDRYDLLFAITLFFSLYLAAQNERYKALFWAGVGVPLKLISGLFIPFFALSFLKEKNLRMDSLLKWFILPALLCLGITYLLFQEHVLSFFSYHQTRGIQIESCWATFHYLIHTFMGSKITFSYSFGAQHLTQVDPLLVLLANYGVYASLILLFIVFVTRTISLPDILLTSLIFFLTFSKVLSPQYFIWLLPLSFLFMKDKHEIYLFCGILILTGLTAFNYFDLMDQHPLSWSVLSMRNGLLVAWMGYRFWGHLKATHQSLYFAFK